MKKKIFILFLAAVFVSLSYASATCVLTPTLLSQDPYPAVPGDYVKLVFQVTGMENSDCGRVNFQLVPDYPISFDPGVSSYYSALGGSYAVNYNNYLTIPFTVRVDPNSVKGNNTIYFRYTPLSVSSNSSISTPFNLSIQDVKSDFYVFVKNYDFTTRDLTLEILNIGQNDVDSLTVTVPPNQNNITVKGPDTYVVGSLSSNDFTTADFEVLPNKADINLVISYNDITGTRRTTNETVIFDSEMFRQPASSPIGLYVLVAVVVLIVAYIFYRRHKKNKKKKLLRE